MQELKADTSVKVVVGPVVDKDDALTPITTLDISTADEAEIMKHDAAAVTDISAYTWAAIASADGYYNLTLTAGAVDTEGMLTVLINDDSLCLPVKETFMVLAADAWDAKYSTGKFEANVASIDAGAVTAAAIATDAVDADALAADALAEINTQVDTALSDIHLDHLLAATYDPASKPGAADALLNEMVENDAGVSRFTANALEQGPGGGATAAAIADAVWDEAKSGHVAAGSFGEEVQAHALSTEVAALNDPTAAAIADAVWDEVLTAGSHDVGYSAGQRLRYLILTGATAQAGAANSITLAATESAVDNIFAENVISIVSGTGAGQTRLIAEYDGTSKVAKVDKPWEVNPAVDSVYEILPFSGILVSQHGTATAGASLSITLSAAASATNDTYIGSVVYISSGTGLGQVRLITDYDGTTKVATVADAWTTNPDATSVYKVLPVGRVITDTVGTTGLAQINAEADTALADYDPPTKTELDTGLAALPTAAENADAIWDEAKAGHVGAGSFGAEVQAHALSSEVLALNDLSAAQVNAEVDTALADYDPPTKAELDALIGTVSTNLVADLGDGTITPEVNVKKINDVTITGDGDINPFDVA